MTNTEKSKVVRKIAKHRGQYYITLGMLEDAGACHKVRFAIAKRLKMPYPDLSDAEHPERTKRIRFTEELLRKVMGSRASTAVAKPWQVLDYVADRADDLYGSRICSENYNTEQEVDYQEVDYFGSSFHKEAHKEAVDFVVGKFREWGYIE